ncbi:NgoMIV family type II restriction endonuclease [Geothrix sp. PMB-07]|uniref:NgoMIV family type II restriction endonuclease n=1 Tax=Geothrix sp. PMB-07 TaxID=3068640 RepID=UPI0027421AA8|nr:NgoMIV family type II restriction endonuclease [Geothrix sp. PMB-07]WLT31839.1 NgoMIV family type II restriction endonuclease [Geothrix sp. PMB-07]
MSSGKREASRALLAEARRAFHVALLSSVLTEKEGVPSNADRSNGPSVAIAKAILSKLGMGRESAKAAGQTAGNVFELLCRDFLGVTFPRLGHLRPGIWEILHGEGRSMAIEGYEQFAHLGDLERLANSHPELKAFLGNDYTIKPDILVIRHPEEDEAINRFGAVVDDATALKASLRKSNKGLPILHASISCKWTMRSDRAQNARTEALNLIRNRKGRLPHIVVVTAEPTPSRLASIALGTGDIDCVYHFALHELVGAVAESASDDSRELLQTMIEGKRLRDISDLPLDLAT